MARTTALVDGATLVLPERDTGPIPVGTPAWFAWLEQATTFAFRCPAGRFTARKERQERGDGYWKAYRTSHGTLHRVYLGKAQDLTLDRLNQAAVRLAATVTPTAPDAAVRLAARPAPATAVPTLLATKLFIPPVRANLVGRPRLFERLQAGLTDKLTLVAAPAGFGKTTLVSAWLASLSSELSQIAQTQNSKLKTQNFKVGWVSLDRADNDPLRFWSYVITALDTLASGVGTSALALLQSPQPPPIASILTGVLNAFSAAYAVHSVQDSALVLDDYHVITAPAIHDMLALLLEYLPPQLHLVILTRADPALPLARLRARGAVTELHASDLRFTPDEAAAFLNQVMGLSLTAADLAALEMRTEGWIAGLQLAALAMRDHQDRSGFIRSFRGSNRYIVEYLAAEVFAHQPAHIQTFLLQTAILDRMCGSLCDAVMGIGDQVLGIGEAAHSSDPQSPIPNPQSYSQLILDQLERDNLFVMPLDDHRHWYRYHHLFADVLRHRLTSGVSAETVAALHRRASVWYQQHELVAEAIQHGLTAADGARVADLIEQHGLRIIVGGQVHTVLGWLSALPDTLIRVRPLLCTIHALALLFTNELGAAEARIKDAERGIQTGTSADQVQLIQGRAAAIRANIARYTGDIAGCVAYGHAVLQLLPETEMIARTIARLHVARAFRVTGDVRDDAERRAIAVIAPFQAADNLLGRLAAITNLARLQVLQGRLYAAVATYREMTQIASRPDEPLLLEGPAYYAGMGELLREWNDLDAAEQHLAQAMEQVAGRLVVDAEDVALGYLALARLQQARGNDATAQRTLETYRDLARQRGFVAHLLARGAAVQAQLALAQGDVAAAVAWANASELGAADDLSFVREADYLILARVWIAQASSEFDASWLPQALGLLERLLADAEAKARWGSVLEILIVRALTQWAQEAHSDALTTLERALTLAAPAGAIRRFVDEGPAMAAMLQEAQTRGIAPQYVETLLATFTEPDKQTSRQGDKATGGIVISPVSLSPSLPVSPSLVEPLSARELEVLRLIAGGMSNAEVARTLVIAISTVKTHTNSIFSKMQVTSRTQAIALARDLQLL